MRIERHYIKILLTLFSVLVAFSCIKDDAKGQGEGGHDISLDWPGYISFYTEQDTKADNAVTSMVGRDFSVIAYKYNATTNWNVYKATAYPTPEFNCPQTISWDGEGSRHIYDASSSNAGEPLVNWAYSRLYTFFGIYPKPDNVNGPVRCDVTKSTKGVPNITYAPSFIEGGTVNDTGEMKDVMTASIFNTDNSNSNTVPLVFKHRLSLICVEARNFNETPETLKNMTVTITTPIYKTATIPLDHTMDIVPGAATTSRTTFEIVPTTDPVVIQPQKQGGVMSSQTTDISRGRNILLIPQQSSALGEMTVVVTYTDSGDVEHICDPITVNRNFESGKKYSIILSITSTFISVAIIESGEWIDSDQNIFFE